MNQVCKSHSYEGHKKPIVYLCARAESEKPNELTLERNLRLIRKQRKIFLTPATFLRSCHAKKKVLNRFFRIRDLGSKLYTAGGMPKITLGITGFHEVLGRDYMSELGTL